MKFKSGQSGSIDDNSVIGIGAVVLNNAVIGKNCMVGANVLVLENQTIPDGSLVIGTEKIKSKLSAAQIEEMKKYSQHYLKKSINLRKILNFFVPKNKFPIKN